MQNVLTRRPVTQSEKPLRRAAEKNRAVAEAGRLAVTRVLSPDSEVFVRQSRQSNGE